MRDGIPMVAYRRMIKRNGLSPPLNHNGCNQKCLQEMKSHVALNKFLNHHQAQFIKSPEAVGLYIFFGEGTRLIQRRLFVK